MYTFTKNTNSCSCNEPAYECSTCHNCCKCNTCCCNSSSTSTTPTDTCSCTDEIEELTTITSEQEQRIRLALKALDREITANTVLYTGDNIDCSGSTAVTSDTPISEIIADIYTRLCVDPIAPSYISALSFNDVTKELVVTGEEDAFSGNVQLHRDFVGNTLFVDVVHGNDTTAAREREDLPYATIQSAINNAVAGDTVHVRAGTYVVPTIFLKDQVTLYFEEGAIITNSSPSLRLFDYFVPGSTAKIDIQGHGDFRYNGTSQVFRFRGLAVDVNIEADNIVYTWRGIAFQTEGDNCSLNVHVNENITLDATSIYVDTSDTFFSIALTTLTVVHPEPFKISWGGVANVNRMFQVNGGKTITVITEGEVILEQDDPRSTLARPDNALVTYIHRGNVYSRGVYTDPYVPANYGVVIKDRGITEIYGNIFSENRPIFTPFFANNGIVRFYDSTMYAENVIPIYNSTSQAISGAKVEFHNCHISDGAGNTDPALVKCVDDTTTVEGINLWFYSCHFEKNQAFLGTGGVLVRNHSADFGTANQKKLLLFNCTILAAANQDAIGTDLVGLTAPVEFYLFNVVSNKGNDPLLTTNISPGNFYTDTYIEY